MSARLGVIADDLTGACDVAAAMNALGVPTEIRLGVPRSADPPPDADCVIVALRSRTAPASEAVADSVRSARMLQGWGARMLYQKYCSTFDSTDAGNIGPVADALVAELGDGAISVGTPATPAVDRTMHRGHLFVGDRLLSESSLATHPLTPMRDPDLVRVLSRQTPNRVGLVPIEQVRRGAQAVSEAVSRLRADGARHLLVDAVLDEDLQVIADALADAEGVLVGGAAGLIAAIARGDAPGRPATLHAVPAGGMLIVSGSGSERTREQVAQHTGPVFRLDVGALAEDAESAVVDALEFLAALPQPTAPGGVPLVTATADPAEVARVQERWGRERTAALVEESLARIALAAVGGHGIRRILVAGGETSGAVAAALGVRTLRVRRTVAPGVAWTTATDGAGRMLDLCLKSGNFGGADFFRTAWEE